MPEEFVLPAGSPGLPDSLVSLDSMQLDSLWRADSLGVLELPAYGVFPDSLSGRPLVVWDVLDPAFFMASSAASDSSAASIVEPIPEFPNHVRTHFPPDIFLLVLLASATLLVVIRAAYFKIFGQIFTAVYDHRASARIYSSRTELYRNMSVLVRVLFLVNSSLFVHELAWWYGISLLDLPLPLSLVLVALAIGVLCVLHYLMCKFLGAVFMRSDFFDEYLYNVFVFYMAYAVLLALPVFAIPFVPASLTPAMIWIGLGMGIALLFMRLLRSFQIILSRRFPVFYFLLYLCTLEIIPVLIFIKIAQQIM